MKTFHVKLAMLCLAFIFVQSCQDEEVFDNQTLQEEQAKEPLTVQEINSIITQSLETTGDFDWSQVSAHTLWSAVKHGNNILTIGYGQEGEFFS